VAGIFAGGSQIVELLVMLKPYIANDVTVEVMSVAAGMTIPRYQHSQGIHRLLLH
jgi:hypothetical protein